MPLSNRIYSDLPLCSASPEAAAEFSVDREALIALYESTDGANWLNNDNWLSDAPIGEWFGVGTDGDGRVVELGLGETGLSGAIPPEIGDFAHLEFLALFGNQLSGEIPPELGDLSNLTALGLMGNQLSGAIPPELGGLSKLSELDLSENQLSGAVPAEIGNLANLEFLELWTNQLSGAIPPEIGNLSI